MCLCITEYLSCKYTYSESITHSTNQILLTRGGGDREAKPPRAVSEKYFEN